MRHGLIYILPFSKEIFGNQNNTLVNKTNNWADERGITAIIIDPSKYNGTEMMEIKAI